MTSKNLIICILSGALVFLLFYLLGAFVQTSFNIREWSESTRGVVAIMGGFFSITVMSVMMIYKSNEY
jgi:hypothetical protein